MLNIDNYGILKGYLKTEPVIKNNKDGSKKVILTVMVSENYRGTDGIRPVYPIPCEAYIPASKAKTDAGPYSLLHEGDFVDIEYTMKNKTWEVNGHPMTVLTLQIDTIKFDAVKNKEIKDLYQMKQQIDALLALHGVSSLADLIGKTQTPPSTASAPADNDDQLMFSDNELDI